MREFLARAVSSPDGKLELPTETPANAEGAKVIGFLVGQGWLEPHSGDGAWTLTSAGRFWLDSLNYGDIVKFFEYGGAVFLLTTRSQRDETIVWHKGRFATISIAHFPHPEHFEVRKENEPITVSVGVQMEDALAAACVLIAEDLDVPESPKPDKLRLHMLKYLELI